TSTHYSMHGNTPFRFIGIKAEQ
ncbi:hypothetical protein CCACVL1_06624, partial [Corchorus capsularis]